MAGTDLLSHLAGPIKSFFIPGFLELGRTCEPGGMRKWADWLSACLASMGPEVQSSKHFERHHGTQCNSNSKGVEMDRSLGLCASQPSLLVEFRAV